MKKTLQLFILLFCLSACSQKKVQTESVVVYEPNFKEGKLLFDNKWLDKNTDTSTYKYPCTIDSVILMFFNTWEDTVIEKFMEIPDSTLANYNHGYGQWCRNSYGLWGRNCLVRNFWRLGIMHPDDMSAILLTSFHRYLNGREIELNEQVNMYKSFWKETSNIEYKVEDSSKWEMPPSMWDRYITEYKSSKKD